MWAFFGVLGLFLISGKKPTKVGFFGRFSGVDRKLLQIYLHNTNFNLFLDTFFTFLDYKNHNKASSFLSCLKNIRKFLSADVRCAKNLLIKTQENLKKLGF